MAQQTSSAGPTPKQECKSLQPWDWKSIYYPLLIILMATAIFPWSAEVFHGLHHLLRALPLETFFATVVQASSYVVVIGIAVLIYLLDRKRAMFLPYFLCAVITASGINAITKQIGGRSRPEWSVAMSPKKRAELQEYSAKHPDYAVSLDRKDHWYGPVLNRPWFMDRYASFPSGHATGVFAMAAFLCVLYPEARAAWLFFAAACALARVFGSRHYLEDIMVGGSMGWLIALWTFSWQWPHCLGQRLFARTKQPQTIEEPKTTPITAQ